MITRYDSLNISSETGKFFLPYQRSVEDDVMTEEEYENVKKFCQTMKLKDLGELNKIYNCQDTIILCEIFEQHNVLCICKNYLNITPENVILQIILVVMSTVTKFNVV